MDETVVTATRRALHGVAELLLAGPQHRAHGTIRLRATPGGFGTLGDGPRVRGTGLVHDGGETPLRGTFREVGAAAGLEVGAPVGVYADLSGSGPDDEIVVDPAAAALLAAWFASGDAALRSVFDQVEPVLWPEHFDLAATVDEVNYGVSAGDAGHPLPYAYVGPWQPREGAFWNVPFGALRAAADLAEPAALAAFFDEGRISASRG